MNKKLAFIGILLLVGLTLPGCVTVGGYGYRGYGYGYDYGYGYYGYPHGNGSYHNGYGNPHHDRDGDHRGSESGPSHWR